MKLVKKHQQRHGRGRPVHVAVIPWNNDRAVDLIREFWDATSGLNYRDRMALSRACRVHEGTVRRWKYKVHVPQYDTMLAIIAWVKDGKPTVKQYHPHPSSPPSWL